jgi:Leucine-rich repeat (LRR) protein
MRILNDNQLYISALQNLQELILFKNQLKTLPDDLSGLSMLKSLSLAHNKVLMHNFTRDCMHKLY